MTSRLLISVNAGLLGGSAAVEDLTRYATNLSTRPEVTIASTPDDIKNFISESQQKPADQTLIMGGDGTTAAVMKGLRETDTVFGIIPTGSTNNIAHSLGLDDDIERAIEVINAGHEDVMDAGKVNGHIFLESVGVGLLANIMSRVGEQDSKKEVFKVVRHSVAELVTVDIINVDFSAGERHMNTETIWLTITNTGRAAAAVVDPTSSIHDGRLELIYCDPIEIHELAKYTIAFIRQNHINQDKFHRMRDNSFKIALGDKLPVHIDGVLYSFDNLDIDIVSGAFNVYTS